jgi:HEPN domain-containing protein
MFAIFIAFYIILEGFDTDSVPNSSAFELEKMAKTRDSINNWIKSSNYDIRTAEHILRTGRYIYVLFMCHLSVEKLLKALYEAVLKKISQKHIISFISLIQLDWKSPKIISRLSKL